MDIQTGKYDLIYGGLVIVNKGDSISFNLPDNIEGDYTIEVKFVENPGISQAKVQFSAPDRFHLIIELINFNGFSGGGNNEILHIGTLGQKLLFLNYRVFDLPPVSYTFMYNFYTEKRK